MGASLFWGGDEQPYTLNPKPCDYGNRTLKHAEAASDVRKVRIKLSFPLPDGRGCWACVLGFRVRGKFWDLGLGVQDLGLTVRELRFQVWGLGVWLRVWGSRFRI